MAVRDNGMGISAEMAPRLFTLFAQATPALNRSVAERLRQSPWGQAAALIAVTGWGQEDDKQQASAAGFDHHLTKPVDPKQLKPLIESVR